MRKVYVHEINRLKSARTAGLYEAMERQCLPLYAKHGIEMVGYWETVMGQGPWPETIAVWEFRDFGHYTDVIRQTYDPADPLAIHTPEGRAEFMKSIPPEIIEQHSAPPAWMSQTHGERSEHLRHHIYKAAARRNDDGIDGRLCEADIAGHDLVLI